jgi:hypothetical protein
MVVVHSDRFEAPSGTHDERVRAWTRSAAIDTLGDRTVWSAAALPSGHVAAQRLSALLHEDLTAQPLGVDPDAEAQISGKVSPGDVVVLHDALSVGLARAVREHGGHAICHIRTPRGPQVQSFDAGRAFVHPHADAVDAFVVSWQELSERQQRVECVAALLPKAGLAIVKDAAEGGSAHTVERCLALTWISVLGDVVEDDRDDRVGGTLHARPLVARR